MMLCMIHGNNKMTFTNRAITEKSLLMTYSSLGNILRFKQGLDFSSEDE